MEAAVDALDSLDTKRIEARRDKVTAQRHLAEAKSRQREAVNTLADARRRLDAARSRMGMNRAAGMAFVMSRSRRTGGLTRSDHVTAVAVTSSRARHRSAATSSTIGRRQAEHRGRGGAMCGPARPVSSWPPTRQTAPRYTSWVRRRRADRRHAVGLELWDRNGRPSLHASHPAVWPKLFWLGPPPRVTMQQSRADQAHRSDLQDALTDHDRLQDPAADHPGRRPQPQRLG